MFRCSDTVDDSIIEALGAADEWIEAAAREVPEARAQDDAAPGHPAAPPGPRPAIGYSRIAPRKACRPAPSCHVTSGNIASPIPEAPGNQSKENNEQQMGRLGRDRRRILMVIVGGFKAISGVIGLFNDE